MSKKRLGIPMIGGHKWMGGISYTELLLKALQTVEAERRPECCLIAAKDKLADLPLYERLFPFFSRCLFQIRSDMTEAEKTEIVGAMALPVVFVNDEAQMLGQIDAYYPAIFSSLPGGKTISWIPDFQHCLLPEFFVSHERQARDADTIALLAHSSMVVFSSEAVRADFQRFFPEQDIPAAVLHFYSWPEEEWYAGDPVSVAARYGLPEKFFICCNQFWLHKNHKILGDALALVKALYGVKIPLVCTGSTKEYRAPAYMELLRQYWLSLGVADQIFVLDMIPRHDQLQLIRRSLAVVQPSLAEGWSTVVEDARALGKKMFLSALNVHREQNPAGAEYFEPFDAPSLADMLYTGWQTLPDGPDREAEERARAAIPELVRGFAGKFLDILDTAVTQPARAAELQAAVYETPAVDRDIPGQLNGWGRDLLERYWLMGQLLAESVPISLPVTIWRGGIGPLPLALQALGFAVTVAGGSPVDEQFLQLLTRMSVSVVSSLPEGVEMVALNNATSGWDCVIASQPQRILLICSAAEGEDWRHRLAQAGYAHRREKANGDWLALAGAKEPWLEQVETSPFLPATAQAMLAYRQLADERDRFAASVAKLQTALEESEADRAARGEALEQSATTLAEQADQHRGAVQRLEGWLQESEADRQARWEIIQQLTQHDIPALQQENADLRKRLERINASKIVRAARKIGIIEKDR